MHTDSATKTAHRSPDMAATFGLLLLKASIVGLTDPDGAPAALVRKPVLAGGAAAELELA